MGAEEGDGGSMESSLNALRVLGAWGVTRLVSDSRAVRPGDAFVAYPGETLDGRAFIPQAIAAGASAVLWESAHYQWNFGARVKHWPVRGLRAKVGAMASHVCGRPSSRLWMVGVTGTNGKTSCTQWIARALTKTSRNSVVTGTLGNGFPHAMEVTANTTSDATVLHAKLAQWYGEGARAAVMEVSSHGLEQGRLAGVEFDVAVFTNLTRDHLDYHRTMAAYGRAKARLFAWETLQYAIVNLDDAFGRKLAHVPRHAEVIGYGFGRSVSASRVPVVAGRNLRVGLDGIRFDAATPWGALKVQSRVLGRFNAENLLATATALLASGVSPRDTEAALTALTPVPGRAEFIGGGSQPVVVVDYAHTPDALDKTLATLRELISARARLICVFGCGGDRDRGKRPQMGRIATRRADEVIVTSDNPRNEAPMDIIAEIMKGAIQGARRCTVIENRAQAVREAIGGARRGDIVLIAGKGHELYQEIAGVRHPYSDLATARWAMRAAHA